MLNRVDPLKIGQNHSEIRAKLDHPVVDGDGHAIEYGPAFFEYLQQVAGPDVVARYRQRLEDGGWYRMSAQERLYKRVVRPTSWGLPAQNTLDRATAMLPKLLRKRLDEFGIDFTVVYSTLALPLLQEEDDELRRAGCRALNVMFADLYADQSDRMTPAAVIPCHTPQEAIEELEYAVKTLGFKVAMFNTSVRRPVPIVAKEAPQWARYATWVDCLCMDGPYDYDPLWQKCVELKVAVTSHSGGRGGSRVVTNHYIYNHVGSFAAGGESFAKGVLLGGVSKRFPTLNFAFLEGGVAWAAELYAGLVGHCGKRHPGVIASLDPKNIDLQYLADLIGEYGQGVAAGKPDPRSDFARWPGGWHWADDGIIAEELANIGIRGAEDLRPLFEENFYFGCEADDPLVSSAFNTRSNPFGATLKAIFSSDLGHWDVTDMSEVLEEAHELVEHDVITASQFRDFVYTNPVSLHARMNPDFFKGTVIERDVAQLLASTESQKK